MKKTKTISKTLVKRINELNTLAKQVDEFYIDFDSTVENTIFELSITYNNKFVWINAEGMEDIKERITLSCEDAKEDLKYYFKHLRKGIKKAIKNNPIREEEEENKIDLEIMERTEAKNTKFDLVKKVGTKFNLVKTKTKFDLVKDIAKRTKKDMKKFRIDEIRRNAKNFLKYRDTDKVKASVAHGNLKSYLTGCKTWSETGLSYLAGINTSSKIEKAEKLNTDTLILYLLPASLSGVNVCFKSTAGCRSACLNTSGRVKMDSKNIIQTSRLIKTVLFYANRALFMDKLNREIKNGKKNATKKGFNYSVRLNGTSDLSLEIFKIGNKNILELNPNILFYDYTKQANRVFKMLKYSNYHLTFSYSETNQKEVAQFLNTKINIAVPFLIKKGQDLPKTYLGRTVVDADLTDLRYLDPKGIIAGLRVKEIKNKAEMEKAINSNFIVSKY